MYKDPKEFLKHINDECLYLIGIKKDLSYEEFAENETLKRAVVRSLEIIGEATKKISFETKDKFHTISWKNMAGMRDRLIHDYMGVNYKIVWDVMINKIPDIHHQISYYLENEE